MILPNKKLSKRNDPQAEVMSQSQNNLHVIMNYVQVTSPVTSQCFKMATGEAVGTVAETTVSHLEDDKPAQEGEFVGATLQIESETQNAQESPEAESEEPALSRNRPGSVIGRQSVLSTSSRTSMRPGVVKSEAASKSFFSYKVKA